MRHKAFISLIILVLCLPQLATAQLGRWNDDGAETSFEQKITTGNYRPFIEANYGVAKPRFEGLNSDFGTLGVMELKLGYASVDTVRKKLVSLDQLYAFGSYFGEDIRPSGAPDEGDVGSELARFGLGNRLGYGYGGGFLGLEMYNQNSINWTRITPLAYDDMAPDAQAVFDRYEHKFRFGQLMEAGLKARVFGSFSLSVGAEGAVIFPRTVFWPWLGSAMLYSGAQGALQHFSEQIVDVSPVIGPMLHFVLKTGVSLGYYMMLREDMHWPFDYETPMTVESLKLGATITF